MCGASSRAKAGRWNSASPCSWRTVMC
ncbi:MAG: hypothetical protein LBE08_10600 [Bifidobacteriaceae bacterium]|nr:hypothetical protein [Bifidobacteriaceae bacterium]